MDDLDFYLLKPNDMLCGIIYYMNIPNKISDSEWLELKSVKAVADSWGLDGDEKPEDLGAMIYGVKFDYATDGPGYSGPLYLLKGGGSPDYPPLALVRREGRLETA